MKMLDLQPPIPRFAIAALGGDRFEISASLKSRCWQLLQRLEEHHAASYAHSIRVARLTMAMHGAAPAWMGCAAQALLGSLLHDVGKLYVPAAILASDLPLSPEERRTVMGHAAAGAALLSELGFPAGIIEIVAHHHERWSAGGYPSGRPAREFAQVVRAVAVADAFTAMTEPGRSYRRPLAPEAARQELMTCRGEQFDAEAVAILSRCITQEAPRRYSDQMPRRSFGERGRRARPFGNLLAASANTSAANAAP
jgi:putative nucleotidyltransferase with HDIG domain